MLLSTKNVNLAKSKLVFWFYYLDVGILYFCIFIVLCGNCSVLGYVILGGVGFSSTYTIFSS